MYKTLMILIASTALVASPLFADTTSTTTMTTGDTSMSGMDMSDMNKDMSNECHKIAKACIAAGYTRHSSSGKLFWKDCMKPILLGQTVSGVTVSSSDVTTCKSLKIKKMQNELNELQGSSGT